MSKERSSRLCSNSGTAGGRLPVWRGVKRGEEEGGCWWDGRWVSELMTVLSVGAERAEMEGASVFSTTVRWPGSPRANRNRKKGASC